MISARFSREEKIHHLVNWSTTWVNHGRGESMWAYSLRLGGSHALLNGWAGNPRLLKLLTAEERRRLEMARARSAQVWRDREPARR
ncbi:hypothetical protein [Streptomyces sp. NBC_01176]|uniref:hypothetical protein n=1 Tax=Streptomyces sp. NBC_01176 TaxID=2903760 RepID=UPI002F90D9AE|nr:hypothetical protein OG199_44855 [Streptomyces sp. NBC_01176]